ncbi:MAG: pyruvate kinase [Pyramidobacter sp.]|jgi:pyruvate kinase
MEHKVKIVCTLGPASLKKDVLGAMIDAGMNVARLNFSHGTRESHLEALHMVRELAAAKKRHIAVMLDTKGPEIRTTLLDNDQPVQLQQGQLFELRPDNGRPGCGQWVGVTYPMLAEECRVGQDVFIDDGTIHMKIKAIRGSSLVCEVVVGGTLSNHKGINIPDAEISMPTLSDKDREDILWGVKNGVDSIAISFVRNREDVLAVRRIVEESGGDLKLISKIESRKAVERLQEIADVSDGMMVARGDLGVEIPTEDVPLIQKQIIDVCRVRGKQTIVATQMLDSMIRNPRPTRAESNDVANAVLDGADAVMLSGESAAGRYPVLAVETMVRIVAKAETGLIKWQRPFSVPTAENSVPDGVSMAAVEIAKKLKARAIVTLTMTGLTARMVSKYRPVCPIVAVTYTEKACRSMCFDWGVFPVLSSETSTEEQAVSGAVEALLREGYAKEGDLLVITAGLPLGVSGTTNMIRVHTIGSIVARGLPVIPGIVTGRVLVARSAEGLGQLQKGDILVAPHTDKSYLPSLDKVSAVITEQGGLTSHAAIVCLELGIPCIVGTNNASTVLSSGMIITADCKAGVIYKGVVNAGA